MATEPYLRDLLITLKGKINNAAQTATAEELAYLGKALESIVGRATVLDVEMIGDLKTAEVTAALLSTRDTILAAIEAKRVSTNDSVNTNAATAVQQIEDKRVASNTSVTNTVSAGQTAINGTRDAAILSVNNSAAAVTAAASAAVLTPAKLLFLTSP